MFSVETNDSVTPGRIRLSGDLNIYHAVELCRSLRPLAEAGVEWEADVSAVTEIDTAGIQVLLLCKRLSAQRGGAFRLVNHGKALIDVLDTLNLAGRFGDPIVMAAAH
jgi:anti-anti-sigma factor